MRRMTEENLKSAFSGESQAHMRYLLFSERADMEGYKNISRLFKAIAYAELVHARNHYTALGMIRLSSDNLQVAIEGETYEVDEMYPAYHAVAELQGEKEAQRSMNWALQAERVHAGMYMKAKQAVERGEDPKIGPIYICEICGYTVEGEAPTRCPVCGAIRERFREF
ncbi:MAG: rubrerythrin family protein [Candidatus Bathyarchaeia archaeon]|nr:rubrerythrin family protein [Candidatus Bathyarchaeota archaeon]